MKKSDISSPTNPISAAMELSSAAGRGEESPNWQELPRDVLSTILMKLTPRDILENMQYVCKSWHEACKDPAAWTKVAIECIGDLDMIYEYQKMAYIVLERSCGRLLEISLEHVCDDLLLSLIAERSSHLRCLRIRCCYGFSYDAFCEAFEKLPLLEEVEFTLCAIRSSMIRSVGINCPNLVSFKLNGSGSCNPAGADNEDALAIAETMPCIRHLQLIGNAMTNEGLQAILDRCLCLESLDLRACFHVDLSGSLGKVCADKVRDIKRPHDSTSDYSFQTTDYDSDFVEHLEELEHEFYMSDDDNYEFSDDSDYPDYEDLLI